MRLYVWLNEPGLPGCRWCHYLDRSSIPDWAIDATDLNDEEFEALIRSLS